MSKKNKNVTVFHHSKNLLGEGLFIDNLAIYWLDITNSLLLTKTYDGEFNQYTLPEKASSIWKLELDLLYLASESGICTFSLKTKQWNTVAKVEQSPAYRANDGGCIFDDKYLFGTMLKEPQEGLGLLYLTNGRNIEEVFSGIAIPNSFILKTKNEILISDSLKKIIYSFKFNELTQKITKVDIWLDLSSSDFTPDGGCIDSQNNIYIAMWDGACVNKYDNDGNFLLSYQLNALRPTNCKLSIDEHFLYVTTATEDMSDNLLNMYPDSGSVLKIELG